jgi:hypothetical protein
MYIFKAIRVFHVYQHRSNSFLMSTGYWTNLQRQPTETILFMTAAVDV